MNNSVELMNTGIEIALSRIEPLDNKLRKDEKVGSKTAADGKKASVIGKEDVMELPTVEASVIPTTMKYEDGKLYRDDQIIDKKVDPKNVERYLASTGKQKEDKDMTH